MNRSLQSSAALTLSAFLHRSASERAKRRCKVVHLPYTVLGSDFFFNLVFKECCHECVLAPMPLALACWPWSKFWCCRASFRQGTNQSGMESSHGPLPRPGSHVGNGSSIYGSIVAVTESVIVAGLKIRRSFQVRAGRWLGGHFGQSPGCQ
jgi:hypothetical protein